MTLKLITKKPDGTIKARMVTKGHPTATAKGFANPYLDVSQAYLSSEPYTAQDWAIRCYTEDANQEQMQSCCKDTRHAKLKGRWQI